MTQFLTEAKDLLLNRAVKRVINNHRPGAAPDVLLFGTPRGGTTWLMELIWSQPGFKSCNEPLDLRNPLVRKHLRMQDWRELHSRANQARVEEYLRRYHEGDLFILDPLPMRGRYHRLFTRRIVYKLIHGAEDRVERLSRALNGVALLLIRHPIPVSLSRRQLPRLQAFLDSDYREYFSDAELALADRIMLRGDRMEQAMLDWCIQTAIPLRTSLGELLVVSYEQLVLEPETAIPVLARRLELPRPDLLVSHLERASGSSWQSSKDRRELLNQAGRAEARRRLVDRWRTKVSREEEGRLMEIPASFGIDAYRAGSPVTERYWLSGDGSGGAARADAAMERVPKVG